MTRLKVVLLSLALVAAGAAGAQTPPPGSRLLPDNTIALPPDLAPGGPIVNGRQRQPTRGEVDSRVSELQGRRPVTSKPSAVDEVDQLYNQLLRDSAPRR